MNECNTKCNGVGFLLKVKPHMMDEYKRRHAEVWPEMLAALSETGWHNYSLFMREDGLLFGYVETPDFDAARSWHGHQRNKRTLAKRYGPVL